MHLVLPPFAVCLTVLESGEVAAAAASAEPALSIRLTPGAAARFAAGDQAAWSAAEISGDAELATAVRTLARDLEWDVEEDLSRWIGDIAAHRLAETGRRLGRWGREAAENLGRALAEYWIYEQPLIASGHEVREFLRAVDELRDDLARLEQRVQRLSSRAAPSETPA